MKLDECSHYCIHHPSSFTLSLWVEMNKIFPASLDKLYEMLQFVKERAQEAGFSKSHVLKIELAVEEALVNIISYGYPVSNGNIEIQCTQPRNESLRIVLKDTGVPYNPLVHAKKKSAKKVTPAKKKIIGGFGVYFILKIMDEVDYRREENANVLTLIKFKF
jgi:serine/threonine-protein kinase RsbW